MIAKRDAQMNVGGGGGVPQIDGGRGKRLVVRGKRPHRARETPGQLQGSKTPKPEIPRKKLKNYPPDPDPKFLEKN